MKKKKLFSLLMASMLTLAAVPHVGHHILAQEETSILRSLFGTNVKKEVEKGDYFSLQLKVNSTESDIAQKIKYIDITGAAKESFVPREVQINGDGGIYIDQLTYNGQGSQLGIAIEFVDGEVLETSVSLEQATPIQAASSMLEVADRVINVVTGERQQITFTMENIGDGISEAGEMTFELVNKKESEGIEIKTDEINIPEMRKGESRDFTFVADIDQEVVHGLHKIKVIITDKDGSSEKEEELTLKVDSDFMPPSLQISTSNTTNFEVNEPKSIGIDLKNVGHGPAKNVKVELVPTEQIIVADGGNVRYINNIDSDQIETLGVVLKVLDDEAVTVPLKMNLTYKDDLGEDYTDTQTLYINTETATASFEKELTITNIVEPAQVYNVGETFNIGFSLFAEDGAENVTISVSGVDGIVPKSKNLFVERALAPDSTKNYEVSFVAGDDVATGTHLIRIEVKYNLNNEEVRIEQYGTVSIDNQETEEDEEEETGGRPIVMVNQYRVTPTIVKAGENFDLRVDFINRHPDNTAKNIKATLTINEQGEDNTGTVFTPVASSNTFFIGTLGPEKVNSQSITLYTLPNAAPKTYEITVEMVYEDINGEMYADTQTISVPVEQVTKLEIGDVQIEGAEVGMEAYVTARLFNTGKTTISNIKISTVGEGFTVMDNMEFIGTLEKGGSETYEPTIIPNQSGIISGQILIEYEDVTGTVETMTHDFEMDVMEAWVPEPMPEMNNGPGGMGIVEPEMMGEESNTVIYIGIGVGVTIAVIVTTIALKKRRQKKEQAFLDED